jgi:hypothetical protein
VRPARVRIPAWASRHGRVARASGSATAGSCPFGTFLPLLIFLGGYVVHLTLIGAPVARQIYRFGIWTSTLGQEPPGKDRMEARRAASGKKPFFERVRPYMPPAWIAKRSRPFHPAVRTLWYLLVGWWLGFAWVVVSWTPFLVPYPLPEAVSSMLGEVPSVMTLALPG